MALADNLGEKLGPLPVWAWGAIAGGAITAGTWLVNRNKARTEPVTATPTGPATGTVAPAPQPSSGLVTEPGAFYAGPSTGYVPPNGGTWTPPETGTAGPTPAASNDEWTRLAAAAILAKSPNLGSLQVLDALDAYVSGRPLTEAAAAIVETGIRLQGVPPYPVPPITVLPPGTPPTVTPPTPTPTPTPTPPPAGNRPALAPGDTGPDVQRLQRWLNGSTGSTLALDGIYGPATRRAVENFQRFMSAGKLDPGETFGTWSSRWWDIAAYVSATNGTPAP